ncbi:DUF2934 domain-containing protein [Aestuariivirga sp.]|uniref:DUF2934 domain-containing protein n=1 Tax=Aestuariivirga sp. TaxID=2650926 RepID=UPI0039E40CE7
MPAHAPKTSQEEQVRALAYQFWIEEGRPEGRAEIHWQRALERVSAVSIPDVTPVVEAPAPVKTPAARKAAVKAAPGKKAPAKKAAPKKA